MKITTKLRLLTVLIWVIRVAKWTLYSWGTWSMASHHWWISLSVWWLYIGALNADALTPLGLLNFCVLQWFGVRLRRCEQTVEMGARPYHVGERVMSANTAGERASWRIVAATTDGYRLRRYDLARWIWPLTGWWTDYRWIARRT